MSTTTMQNPTVISPIPKHTLQPSSGTGTPGTPQYRHTPEPSLAKKVAPTHVVEHKTVEEREQQELDKKLKWLQSHVGEEEAEKRLSMKPSKAGGSSLAE